MEREDFIEHNVASISGGKDSQATLLLAKEKNADNLLAVFADTGNEHPLTIEHVNYINDHIWPVRTVKADFTARIAGKREFVATHWPAMLISGTSGKWVWQGEEYSGGDMPPKPSDVFKGARIGKWKWRVSTRPVSEKEALRIVSAAVEMLQPTGNPFLDLCIWKGRFPSRRAQFCTQELKVAPITEQIQDPLLLAGDDVISWQGVRADESENRRLLSAMESKKTLPNGATLWIYRPILEWKAADTFEITKRYGFRPNPLYTMGMGRVGCMPCINARKGELREIAARFPEQIERIAHWERVVKIASKRGAATFFAARSEDSEWSATQTIDKKVSWAKTKRGGKEHDPEADAPVAKCSSSYGLCE